MHHTYWVAPISSSSSIWKPTFIKCARVSNVQLHARNVSVSKSSQSTTSVWFKLTTRSLHMNRLQSSTFDIFCVHSLLKIIHISQGFFSKNYTWQASQIFFFNLPSHPKCIMPTPYNWISLNYVSSSLPTLDQIMQDTSSPIKLFWCPPIKLFWRPQSNSFGAPIKLF